MADYMIPTRRYLLEVREVKTGSSLTGKKWVRGNYVEREEVRRVYTFKHCFKLSLLQAH